MHGAGIKSCSAQFPANISDVVFQDIKMINIRPSKSGAIYVNAFSQDVKISSEDGGTVTPPKTYPTCGDGDATDGALLRVHNISFLDIAVLSPVTVTPGKFSCAASAGSCTDFYMRNVSVAGTGKFDCSNVVGSAGARVAPASCFKPATHAPRSCCPLDHSRGPFIPWVRVGNASNVYHIPAQPHGAPGTPLLGVTPTESGCRAMCEANPNCTQVSCTTHKQSPAKHDFQRCF